jgi:hypothetical protein
MILTNIEAFRFKFCAEELRVYQTKKRNVDASRALNCAEELVEASGHGPKTLLVKLKVQSRISGSEEQVLAIETAEEIQVLLEERQKEVLVMQCIANEQGLTHHCDVLSHAFIGTLLFQLTSTVFSGQHQSPGYFDHVSEVIVIIFKTYFENHQNILTSSSSMGFFPIKLIIIIISTFLCFIFIFFSLFV